MPDRCLRQCRTVVSDDADPDGVLNTPRSTPSGGYAEAMESVEAAAEPTQEEFSGSMFTIDTLLQIEAEFVGIDRAIEALQLGTYGRCEVCEVSIPPSRLRVDPVLVRCDAHIVRETPDLFTSAEDFDPDPDRP